MKNTSKDSELNNHNQSKANTKCNLLNNKITRRPGNSRHIPSLPDTKDNNNLKAFPVKKHQDQDKNLLLSIELNSSTSIYPSLIKSNHITIPLEKVEQEQAFNPQYVVDYSEEIIEYWKETESFNIPNYSHIFLHQKKINEKSRALLIDWLAAIHFKYELLPETLYLTITLLDRYTQIHYIDLSEYQLVGISSMLIACKYEEIYAPEIGDFIHISKKLYTKEQILKMEGKIISALNFDILCVSSYRFLMRYYFISGDKSIETFHLAQYIMEMSMMDLSIMEFSQSIRACTALYMARKLKKYKLGWINVLKLHTGYDFLSLKHCIHETVTFLQQMIKSKANSFMDKFKTFEYSQVANLFDRDTLDNEEKI